MLELRATTLKMKITIVAAKSAAPRTMIGDWSLSRTPVTYRDQARHHVRCDDQEKCPCHAAASSPACPFGPG